MATPNVMGKIAQIRKRGKVIVNRSGAHSDCRSVRRMVTDHPGTDAALLLAVVHTLFDEKLVTLGATEGLVDGVDELRKIADAWSLSGVSAVTSISPYRTRELALECAKTERAVVYGRIGLCNQEFGGLASWLVDVVNIITGHLDVPGGLMFPRPAAWSLTTQPQPGLEGGIAEFGTLAHSSTRGERGSGPSARVVHGGGNSHPRRRADPGADHGSRKSGAFQLPPATNSIECCRIWKR